MGAAASDTGCSELSTSEAPCKGSGLPGHTPTFGGEDTYILTALTGSTGTVWLLKSQYAMIIQMTKYQVSFI